MKEMERKMSVMEIKGMSNDQGGRVASLQQEVEELNKKLYDQKNASHHPSSMSTVVSTDHTYLKKIIEDQ